jgi:hypothetical protein
MKTNKNIIGFCILALVLTLNLVIAFSPISGYSQQTPLTIYPGEEKEAIIHIFPTPEEGTISVEATIIEGMNIASITDKSNIYESSPSGEGLVHVKVKVPSNAVIGSEYLVVSRFVDKNQKSATSGTVGFAIEATNTFKVVVVEKPAVIEETPQGEGISLIWWIVGVIIVIAIILIIYFVVKKRRE